jgi:glycosyltransferase involved in cell wall biosynthesis
MNKTPVILQILPSLNSGGVERGTIEIAAALQDRKIKNFVISAGGNLVSMLENINVTHIKLDVQTKNPFKIIFNSFLICSLIKKHHIDIIHARSRAPAWSAFIASKITKKIFITSFHGVYSGKTKIKKFYNSVMLRGNKIIAVSEFIKNHIIENYNFQEEDKIQVIHRGVDIVKFNTENIEKEKVRKYKKEISDIAQDKIILMPARITDWKGQLILLQAALKIKEKHFKIVLVGKFNATSNYYITLLEFIKLHKLGDKVVFYQEVTDIINFYALADLVVSPTVRPEAFGRVIVEAAALGNIVITTIHGGACETVVDKKTGYLIKPNDSDDLAKNINLFFSLTESERKKMQKAAQEHARKNFAITNMQEATIKLYLDIYDRKQAI